MTGVLWKPLPVFTLTIRQFLGGNAVKVVGVLALLPALFSLIYVVDSSISGAQEFYSEAIFRVLFVGTLLPILILILATGALGNEIEDQTLPYLTLKPVSRLRIVVEKLTATVATGFPLVSVGLLISYLLIFRGDAGDSANLRFLGASLAATIGGTAAYAAVFMLVSLLISRALLAGIVYTLIWESLLGRFLPGLRYVSIRHYAESIYVGLVDRDHYYRFVSDPEDAVEDPVGLATAIIVIAVICVVAIALSSRRLRRLNLE